MKKTLLLTAIILLTAVGLKGQVSTNDYSVIFVHKQIGELTDTRDNRTPLEAFVSYTNAWANGETAEMGRFTTVSRRQPSISGVPARSNQPDRQAILGRTVDRIVVYKDSVAGVIATFDGGYSIRYMIIEDGRWVNDGEGLGGKTPEASQEIFLEYAPPRLNKIKRIGVVSKIPTDTISFVTYLKEHGCDPKNFILDALANHRLVAYGEIHHRKVSWDLIRSVIASPEFSRSAGTVFLELSSHSQSDLDSYLDSDTKQPQLILKVLGESYLTGWNDKGMYEFLLDLWDINKSLPTEKRIKVIAPEIPRPFNLPTGTREEYLSYVTDVASKRDAYMADAIELYLDSAADKRSSLFIVGAAHAYKSAHEERRRGKTVVRRLWERLPEGDVFSIIQHGPIVSNNGGMYGMVRGGMFDYAFAENGNLPVALSLKNSPFGKEPYEASIDRCYSMEMGTYGECYDGYIFFQPIDDEPSTYHLEELYGDGFIDEIKRRAAIAKAENQILWGVTLKDLNMDQIVRAMKLHSEKKRWSE